MDIEALKDRIENLLFQYWNEMPDEKPSYTSWFYSEGGVKEKTGNLLQFCNINPRARSGNK